MPCLEGNHAIVIRVVLSVDLLFYFVYAFFHAKPNICWLTSVWLNLNLLIVFFISFMAMTNVEMTPSTEYFGIALAAIFSFMQMFSIAQTIVKIVVFALLSMCSQITNTYLPQFIQAKLGFSIELSSIITLLIPLVILALTQFSIVSLTCTTIVVCVVLSWLSVQAISVFYKTYSDGSIIAPICCSPTSYCSIWTTGYELLLFGGLIAILLLICFKHWIYVNCHCQKKVEHAEDISAKDKIKQKSNLKKENIYFSSI